MLSLASQTNIHGSRFPPGRYPTSKKELALWSTSGCSSVLLSISGLSSASAFGYVATHILLSREEGIDLTFGHKHLNFFCALYPLGLFPGHFCLAFSVLSFTCCLGQSLLQPFGFWLLLSLFNLDCYKYCAGL